MGTFYSENYMWIEFELVRFFSVEYKNITEHIF